VKLFSGHDESGCAWYRMILPHRELAKHGWDITWAGGNLEKGHGFTVSHTRGHDVIVAQRIDKPGTAHVWRDCWTPSTRLVYEQDDDVFSIGKHNWNAYRVYRQEQVRDMCQHAMEVSDLITTTTETLAGVLREHNQNVRVLPNCIPGWVCDTERRRHERPSVGWMGGGSHGMDVGLIASAVRRFLKRFPGWDLRLAGTDYRPTFKVPGERAFFAQWVQVNDDAETYYRLPDFDIGLAPLTPDVFNMSKSPLKALEYGALGIPVIASDWHPYRDYVRHGETGFLVKRDHEWLHYMSILAADDGLREGMGKSAREAARQYTIEGNWQLWDAAYRSLFPRR
jgi:glycosyltransferase involved in cell wall biosynthesis